MKVKIEIEIEVVITTKNNREPDFTDEQILKSIQKETGTEVKHMYIDDFKITKTEIV